MRRADSGRLPEPPGRQTGFTCEDSREVAHILESAVERNGENALAAEEQTFLCTLNSQLEEIPVRRHADGRGEQMREMIGAEARDGSYRREPEIIRKMCVDEIDRAAQATVESEHGPPLVEA